ncbi:hypothetical protein JCM11641_001456 [Rhodosporidiobolus odoratus]
MSASTSTSTSNSSTSPLYRDLLTNLGPITPSTWSRWEELLPKVVAGLSGQPAVEFYLDGTIPREDYRLGTIATVLADADKCKVFERWRKITDALKLAIINYGGDDAAARVEDFDAKLGDAPGLWTLLKGWYSTTETGAERAVLLAELLSARWDEKEQPATFLARLKNLQNQLNSAYKHDATLSLTPTNKHVIADMNAAISDFLLRDLVLTFLPSSYAETILPSVSRSTTFDELKSLLQNLYHTRVSREQIQGIALEAARRVSPAPASSPTPTSSPTTASQPNHRDRRGGDRPARGMKKGRNKLPATKYAGFERWRGGTFKDRDGVVRFKVPNGTCFACFGEGHMARECPESDPAKRRVSELAKCSITVPYSEASALFLVDLNDGGETPDAAVLAVYRALAHPSSSPQAEEPKGRFVTLLDEVEPKLRAFRFSTLEDDFSPPYAFATSTTSDYIIDSGATRHFSTSRDHLHDFVPYTTARPVGGAFGSAGSAIGEGTLVLRLPHGPVSFANVMLVPELGVNLLSMTRMMMAGVRFSNSRTELTITDEEGQVTCPKAD